MIVEFLSIVYNRAVSCVKSPLKSPFATVFADPNKINEYFECFVAKEAIK